MIIYLTTNLINNKSYVGQTRRKDKNYLGSGLILNKAIKKHGRKNFTRRTLKKCDSVEELDFWEKFFIGKFGSLSPDGYNLELGGNGQGKISEKTKTKMSEAKKKAYLGEGNPFFGKTHTKETRLKISKKVSGEKNFMYGKCHSDETIRKMKATAKKWNHKPDCQCGVCKAKDGKYFGSNNPMHGKTPSIEHRDKIRMALKGRPLSEGHIIRLREAWGKRKKTKEEKQYANKMQ